MTARPKPARARRSGSLAAAAVRRPLQRSARPFPNPQHTNHGGQSSRLGAALGLTRIGINYDVVAPGNRTSRPHAESHEEEFVLVLRGRPDVWIDGHLHELSEGDAAVFPAGTGIAHSFLNNSDADVHLLVVGEHGPRREPDRLPAQSGAHRGIRESGAGMARGAEAGAWAA